MLKRVNNWHLSTLVVIVSIFSIALVQQYVDAQGWQDPGTLPGGTPANNLVVNPMIEDLHMGGYDLVDGNFKIDGDSVNAIQVPAGQKICFNGTSDCRDTWPTGSGGVTNPMTEHLGMGGYDIHDTNLWLDGDGINPVQIKNDQYLCLTGDCRNTWPTGSGGESLWGIHTGGIHYVSSTNPNVGIGTATPGYVLEVAGTNVRGDVVKIKGTSHSSNVVFYDEVDIWSGAIGYHNQSDLFSVASGPTDMRFLTGSDINGWGTERMRIQGSTGNVGIGTTTPAAKLAIQRSSAGEDFIKLYDTAGNTKFAIDDNGDVGIDGPVHSGVPLFVNGNSTGSYGVKVYGSGTIWAYNTARLELKGSNDIYLNVGSGGDGVGIEVYDPDEIFHVKNSDHANTLIKLENSNDGASFLNETTQIEFARGPEWSTDYSWVGPTDESTFDVWTTENIPILFGTNAGEKMRIAADGNVGIGTDNPGSALELYSTVVDDSNLKLQNPSGDMRLIFQEYASPPTPYGDMSIRYNGTVGGYNNWLEFWGRNPDTDNPIMTMQRDYNSGENNYLGVGIGVPAETNIDAKLRVQNFGTEDIFQLYDNTTKVLSVADGGDVWVDADISLHHTTGEPYNYLRIDHLSAGAVPVAADCDGSSTTKGRMIYDYSGNKLFICDDSGWISSIFN